MMGFLFFDKELDLNLVPFSIVISILFASGDLLNVILAEHLEVSWKKEHFQFSDVVKLRVSITLRTLYSTAA